MELPNERTDRAVERVLTVILARPQVRNAVDPEHADRLFEALKAFDIDDNADVAVFWSDDGAFCAGADLKSLAERDHKPCPLNYPRRMALHLDSRSAQLSVFRARDRAITRLRTTSSSIS